VKMERQRTCAEYCIYRGSLLHMTLDRDGHLWIRGATHLGEVIDGENRYEPHDLPPLEQRAICSTGE